MNSIEKSKLEIRIASLKSLVMILEAMYHGGWREDYISRIIDKDKFNDALESAKLSE